MIILMHSSKTMRPPTSGTKPSGTPVLLDRADQGRSPVEAALPGATPVPSPFPAEVEAE